ncbi:EscU/YscU/HrcU family type III secretion system export apparatus switch protein [Labrenzia sp. R4_2]|jgi:flagellar biosynthesis protein|uniref:EscU/YscU/HrcU family type III secretion system export apparatus switch protein n=1 Tax=Labrenzia sp. R4_2 TaxID=2821107 RepID=UPI00106286BA|nr:EscU/YscU/HrcU family type III secretion system export apparatus switch protein [Labrenzia sp. R4_2]MBO9418480.1 EscU/YscU/HrcU family type III secretion system export apparatus switch protein [Labrenzia sp. R4_2]
MTTPTKSEKIAVALEYEDGGAPVVSAKGTGSAAQRIEDIAREAGVPIEQNPMMAEALSQIEVDHEIPIELYQAVAVLIGFIMRTGQAQHPKAPGETET